jgi:acetyltransferase
VLHKKINTLKKPIYPILPSVIQAAEEVSHFHAKGHVNFTDEVSFGYVLSRINKTAKLYPEPLLPKVDFNKIRSIIKNSENGYLPADKIFELFDATNINCVKQFIVKNEIDAINLAEKIGFPIVMKVSGPLHKSDVGGVILGIRNKEEIKFHFNNLMKIKEADGVVIQQQLSGIEIYIGAKLEENYGHQILVGLGGIFVEILKDISSGLAPIGKEEALAMLKRLKSYPIIQGTRGKEGINENLIINTILKISSLLKAAPEIIEMDINPLLGNANNLIAVDARICIKQSTNI